MVLRDDEPKIEPKPVPAPVSPTPVEPPKEPAAAKPEMKFASEYDTKTESVPATEPEVKPQPSSTTPAIQEVDTDLSMDAKIGFVIIGIMDHYSDIWVSKKENGVYSVEHMDGKICEFTTSEGRIKFSPNSFSGISTNIKSEIQKKFVELSKLL